MDLSGREGDVPIPISSTFASGHGHPSHHSTAHDTPVALHHYHHPSNGPSPPPLSTAAAVTTTTTEDHHQHHNSNSAHSTKKRVVAKYRECLKNHAASIGGNATDGCGEFMASGGEGTLEALKCSACGCHRNFHRKEPEAGEPCDCFHPFKGRKVAAGDRKGLLISGPDAFGYGHADGGLFPRPVPHHMIMPLGVLHTSESDEMDGAVARPSMVKKRFRTKFTPEQKEKMLSFAERVGWRLQRQEEGVVQQFCQEIGVKRRVLKVWMHNNKHVLAKKNSAPLEETFHGQS